MQRILENYTTHQGSNCIISCVRNNLYYYNIDIDENLIFILGDGFMLEYENPNSQENNNIRITSNIYNSVVNFCSLTGIELFEGIDIDDNGANNVIIDCINKNIPVTIELEARGLDYNKVFSSGENIYHNLNIIGYDINGGSLCISDCYVPSSPPSLFEGWIFQNTICEGRKKARNKYMYIAPKEHAYNNILRNSYDQNYFLRNKIKISLKSYLDGNRVDEKYFGVAALEKFVLDIPNFIEQFGQDFTKKMFNLKMRMKEYGLVDSRYYLLLALQKLANSDNHLKSICYSIEELYKKWNSICGFIIRIGVTKKQQELLFLAKEIALLIKKEDEVFNTIYENL